MARLGRLNLPQRIVLVGALAGFLGLAAIYIITKGLSGPIGGWFQVVPSTGVVINNPNRLSSAATWFVWLAALLVWTVGSLWLLRSNNSAVDIQGGA